MAIYCHKCLTFSTHYLQNVACPHGTKAMFSRAATRQTSHVVGTEAAAGVTVAAVSDTILAKQVIANDIFITLPFDYSHVFHN